MVGRRDALAARRVRVELDLREEPLAVMNFDAAEFGQRGRIPHANFRAAIAHVDQFAVVGESPAFAGIFKFAEKTQGRYAVDKTFVREPGELINAAVENCDFFSEVLRRQRNAAYDRAVVEMLNT